MPAYQQLPWLNSSDQFLQAMQAGVNTKLAREKMQNELAQETIRSFSFGGGRFHNPLSAEAQAWREQYQQGLLDDADKRLEQGEERNRIAAQPRYQFLQPGLGQIARGNPLTGEIKTLQEARDTTKDPTVSLPFYPSGDPLIDAAMGVQPITMRGTVDQLRPYAGTNAPAIFGGQAPQQMSQPSPVNPGGPPTITSKEQFEALNSDDIYIGSDGRKYRKP